MIQSLPYFAPQRFLDSLEFHDGRSCFNLPCITAGHVWMSGGAMLESVLIQICGPCVSVAPSQMSLACARA